ncbi:hypothetical protein B296_00015000, partial [Ensete ventricosum]
PRPEILPQCLSRWRLGNRLREEYPVDPLVEHHLFRDVLLYLLLRDLRSIGPDDEGDGDLSGHLILHPGKTQLLHQYPWKKKLHEGVKQGWRNVRDDGSVRDVMVGDEKGLELRWSYLESFVLDDLLQPVDDEDLVVVVHESDIACVQPLFLVYGVLGCFWVIKVSCTMQQPVGQRMFEPL